MPYKEAERRKAAARKWRLLHRAERAAYMRRYRRSRSSGRSRGRPRSHDEKFTRETLTPSLAPLPPVSEPAPHAPLGAHESGHGPDAAASDSTFRPDPATVNRSGPDDDAARAENSAMVLELRDPSGLGIP
jgi:hypothetical protein